MPPTRPADGAATETEWGQAVHDAVFTPRGTRVAGGASTTVTASTTSPQQLQLNTAVDDPGGWLAADTLTVPSGAAGIYLVVLDVSTDEGDSGEATRIELRLNGTAQLKFLIPGEDSTTVFEYRTGLLELSAGDTINMWAGKSGGTSPVVLVRGLALLKLGDEIGA